MQIEIDKLTTCLPNPEPYREMLTQKLLGQHKYTRLTRDGLKIEMDVVIRDVQIVPEGNGAVPYLIKSGVITEGNDMVACLDLGRGTAIGFLVDMREKPRVIPASRVVIEGGGMQSLLMSMQAHPEMKAKAGSKGDPNINLIHGGIKSGQFWYGTRGFQFREIYEEVASRWLESIRDEAYERWSIPALKEYAGLIDKVVFLGGAAPVAKIWTEAPDNADGFWAIAENPQFANVLGLLDPNFGGIHYVIDTGNGWIKIASSLNHIQLIESFSADLFAPPSSHELDDASVYLEYSEGVAGKFKKLIGASAKDLSMSPIATVRQNKALFAHQLVLAAIQPTTAKTSKRVA